MDNSNFEIISFYKFINLKLINKLKDELYIICKKNSILGTVILSKEGVNGMLAGSKDSIELITSFFIKHGVLIDDFKFSSSATKPFHRLRIKIKKEIISLGHPELSNPNELVGKYVEPEDWNKLIEEENVVLIDTRNKYETSIGTFKNAIVPPLRNFKEFPNFIKKNDLNKNSKIAMFCTGGIRCEKASSYLLKSGFKEVLHLHGGIIKYLETVPSEDSKWEGECFVFDNRVSVEQNLKQGTYLNCNGCGEPLKKEEVLSPKYRKGVSCPKCYDSLTKEKIQKSSERQKQIELSKLRGEVHIGE